MVIILKKGIISISIALILFAFASLSALLLSQIMKEVLEIDQRVAESIDNSFSKIVIISHSNIWKQYLALNAAHWELLQKEIEQSNNNYSSHTFTTTLSIKLPSFSSPVNYVYTSASTTTAYFDSTNHVEKYMNVVFKLRKNNVSLPFGAEIGFGWGQ